MTTEITKLAILAMLATQSSADAGIVPCSTANLVPTQIGAVTGDPEKDTFGYDLSGCAANAGRTPSPIMPAQHTLAPVAGLAWTCTR